MTKHKFHKGQKVFRWQWSPQNFVPHVEEGTVLCYPKDYAGPVCKVELNNGLMITEVESVLFLTKEAATEALINHISWHIDLWTSDCDKFLCSIRDRHQWIDKANQVIHQLTSK